MTVFAVLLAVAALAFGIARLLHLPAIPLLVVAGFGLRQLADQFGMAVPAVQLRELIEIGLAVLVFTAGAELSPRRMRGRARQIVIVAVVQFLVLGLAGLFTARLLDYDWMAAVYLGCALSASSTLVVVRHLQQRRQMFEPYGRLVLGVLLLQDVFIIALMVVLIRLPDGLMAVLHGLVAMHAIGGLSWMMHRWAVPWICAKVSLDDEELMLGALGLLFAFSSLAYVFGLPFLVGAFFAGFALSAFPMNGLVRGMLNSLSGFFLALFFICIGAILTLPPLAMVGHGVIFTLVLIGVTLVLVSIVAEAVGYSTRASVEASLLLSQTSEFSLLIALAGLAHGQVSAEMFSLIAVVTVSTMTLTPFIAREELAWRLMRLHPRYRRGESKVSNLRDHAVMLGYGRSATRLLKLLQAGGLQVVVVDDDAAVIRQLIADGVPCIQGDGSDLRIVAQANCREAKVVLCSMRRTRDAQEAMRVLRGGKPLVLVRAFEDSEAQIIAANGAVPIRTADAAVDRLMDWLELNR